MNEHESPSFFAMSEDHFKGMVAILIAIVTTLTAIVAFLQGDAATRDDRANSQSKHYSLQAMGRLVSGDARVNYDFNAAYQAWYELDILALDAANNGEEDAARRYEKLRDQMVGLSPLLAAPYFDPFSKKLEIAKYEADTYLVENTALRENFIAAADVKEAWDYKANTYIMYLTLLAVSIFLLGMSATISKPATRWIFLGTGMAITLFTLVLTVRLWLLPVNDLRQQGNAIQNYAQGVGLAYQEEYQEAVGSYNLALQTAPAYINALTHRAEAYSNLGEHEKAAVDYEAARRFGDKSATSAGNLAWEYYLLSRTSDAIAMNQVALQAGPDELWIQFDLGLSLLASGQIEAAKAEYAKGMQQAARQVAEAQTAGARASSGLWWSLDDAALSLDDMLVALENDQGTPIENQQATLDAGWLLSDELKSLSVGLEFTGKPPQGTLSAKMSPFQFGTPVYDDQGQVEDVQVGDTFSKVSEIALLYDYEGMHDGQEVIYKVFINGIEDPSWRIFSQWDQGDSGSMEEYLSVAYNETFTFSPGYYTVEMYVDSHLAQYGSFEVKE